MTDESLLMWNENQLKEIVNHHLFVSSSNALADSLIECVVVSSSLWFDWNDYNYLVNFNLLLLYKLLMTSWEKKRTQEKVGVRVSSGSLDSCITFLIRDFRDKNNSGNSRFCTNFSTNWNEVSVLQAWEALTFLAKDASSSKVSLLFLLTCSSTCESTISLSLLFFVHHLSCLIQTWEDKAVKDWDHFLLHLILFLKHCSLRRWCFFSTSCLYND